MVAKILNSIEKFCLRYFNITQKIENMSDTNKYYLLVFELICSILRYQCLAEYCYFFCTESVPTYFQLKHRVNTILSSISGYFSFFFSNACKDALKKTCCHIQKEFSYYRQNYVHKRTKQCTWYKLLQFEDHLTLDEMHKQAIKKLCDLTLTDNNHHNALNAERLLSLWDANGW